MKNLHRHYTPADVAETLAKDVPKVCSRVLDPSVGNGALLIPLVNSLPGLQHVVAFDLDKTVRSGLLTEFSKDTRLHFSFFPVDFLTEASLHQGEKFDCVVMNPPFAARQSELRRFIVGSTEQKGSIEAAFVVKAIRHLRDGGRLLAVLPASLISGNRSLWLRRHLLDTGKILRVHELPHSTFKNVDARVCLLTFEKGAQDKRATVLMNSDLRHAKSFAIRSPSAANDLRLDYGFVVANSRANALRDRNPDWAWRQLHEICDVRRGTVSMHQMPRCVLHRRETRSSWSTECRCGSRHTLGVIARPGDVLVARVGRGCGSSFGLYVGKQNIPVSDCVLVLRLREELDMSSCILLLACRLMVSLPTGYRLLERGTGAVFIASSDLKDLYIPTALLAKEPFICTRYERAAKTSDVFEMAQLESLLRNRLEGGGQMWKGSC